MSERSLTRRELLTALALAPMAAVAAQSPGSSRRRLASNGATCLLREADGTAVGWRHLGGFTAIHLGQGHNNNVPVSTAFVIPGLSGVVDVAMGGIGGYALLTDGRVLAWGGNSRGSVGNMPLSDFQTRAGAGPDALSPTPVLNLTDVATIAAGEYHVLAVTKAGAVYAWGENRDYQLGIGEWPVITYKTRSAQPTDFMPYAVPIPELSGVAAVAAGDKHSLALMRDGTVRAWGLNRSGQLGDGTVISRKTPVVVSGLKNAVAIAADSRNSMALLADGTVMTWGHGSAALGRTAVKVDAPYSTPAPVPGVTGIRAIAISDTHAMALTEAGTVMSWGDDAHGRLGQRSLTPARIPQLSGIQSIVLGGASSFAIDAQGRIFMWGMVPLWARVDGDDGAVSRFPIPVAVKGLKNS